MSELNLIFILIWLIKTINFYLNINLLFDNVKFTIGLNQI